MTSTNTERAETVAPEQGKAPCRQRRGGIRGRQGIGGWLFVSPAVLVLTVFLFVPILLALYVSFTNWDGFTNPLSSAVQLVGLQNYKSLTITPGLNQLNFMTAVRNNFYFVLFVVPLQTALALFLAVLVNDKLLKGKSFFRTAFYFPSVTSSIAITLVFIFLLQGSGAVNRILSFVGIKGPNWLIDKRGLFQLIFGLFGVHAPPGWASHKIASLSIWDWIAGPSIGMTVIIVLVIWTTSGTFMLMFLAALQNISEEVQEASLIDGASARQRFFQVTVPMLRPTLLLVLTLGLIGTWQVFDQIYLVGKNNTTTITPAFYSYQVSFANQSFGIGAAVAFLLFILIVTLSLIQRRLLPEQID